LENNSVAKTLIDVIKAYFNGLDLPNCDNWEEVFALAKRHSLGSLFYLILKDGKILNEELIIKARKHFSAQTAQQVMQEYYSELLISKMEKRKIRLMPLKGYYMRKLYPIPEMRTSCDVDVFYDKERREEILEILPSLGFSLLSTSENDDHWNKDIITVETHFDLTEEKSRYRDYYKDVWNRLITKDGVRYEFSDEDFYIYMMIHAAKHFTNAGFGIRTVLDIYVYNKEKVLDREYLKNEFEKLKLFKFVQCFENLASFWFGKGEINEETELLSSYVIDSGVYGKEDNGVVMRNIDKTATAKSTKRAFLFKMIFPSYKVMAKRYKVLKKCAILLPIMWIVRWFQAVFFRKKNIKTIYKESKMINSDNVANTAKILEITELPLD